MSGYRLTIRHGSEVKREQFEGLDETIVALERQADAIRDEGPLEGVQMFREYEPGQRVHARLELTGPGRVRRPEAGLDVMGDGRLVAYRGGIFKKELTPPREGSVYDALRAALSP